MRFTDSIRALRSVIMDQSVQNVLITSALRGEGKSTAAAHLAVACAQLGKRVLLVDADFRQPTLHKRFSTSNIPGLSDILFGQQPSSAIIALEQPGLFLLPARASTRRACDLVSTRFSAILEKVSQEFDLVIVDAPPMLGFPESLDLARSVSSVLLVTKASATSGKAVEQTLALLAHARANVLGVVMNQVKFSGEINYGYYQYASETDTETASGLGA
jgi:capsular exopolysaccharide synthesis family protein